jgi:hypothetical protein
MVSLLEDFHQGGDEEGEEVSSPTPSLGAQKWRSSGKSADVRAQLWVQGASAGHAGESATTSGRRLGQEAPYCREMTPPGFVVSDTVSTPLLRVGRGYV